MWKLRDPTIRKDYETFVNEKCTELFSNKKPVGVNDAWNKVKTCLLNGVDQVCDWTKFGVEEFGMLKLGGGKMM